MCLNVQHLIDQFLTGVSNIDSWRMSFFICCSSRCRSACCCLAGSESLSFTVVKNVTNVNPFSQIKARLSNKPVVLDNKKGRKKKR